MASDLPPYLTHIPSRNVSWTQHAKFPRNVVKTFRRGDHYWHRDLRIFKLFGTGQAIEYRLLSDEEVQRYMEDPNRV